MEILKMLSAPLIGAVIGYFTNYIAVKMLFFPRHEVGCSAKYCLSRPVRYQKANRVWLRRWAMWSAIIC